LATKTQRHEANNVCNHSGLMVAIKNKEKRANLSGVTLIELCIVMVMTVVIGAVTLAVWNNINRHVINKRRKSLLHAETRYIANAIISQLRRSEAVLSWNPSGITYISPNSKDTVVYEYYDNVLYKNDRPVPIISQAAHISGFNITEIEEINIKKEINLLSIEITMDDDFSNSVTISSSVAVKFIDGMKDEEAFRGWNF